MGRGRRTDAKLVWYYRRHQSAGKCALQGKRPVAGNKREKPGSEKYLLFYPRPLATHGPSNVSGIHLHMLEGPAGNGYGA